MNPQKLHCLINKITDHGDHVYTVCLAPERPLPRFRPGQFLHESFEELNRFRIMTFLNVFQNNFNY